MKKKENEKVGILGFGEIGRAVAKFYKPNQLRIKDLNRDDGLLGVDVLHVCIPWSDRFEQIVKKEIKGASPRLVIIHSTVSPGATKKIGNSLPKSCQGVVHSPARGVHPYLFEGIKTFVKYIGADNKKTGELAKSHLESLGIRTKVFMPSVTTEIGKILDTTYYGVIIAWHGEMKKICDKFKINFEEAVADFNKTYNEGYKKLGKGNVVRPVLYPPRKGCGGHCVLENAVLLRESFRRPLLGIDFVLSMGKEIDSIPEEKPYLNKSWLYCEYWGKGRSAGDIAKEGGCSEENILAILKRRNIPRRDRKWTMDQINKIKKLSDEGNTFKEIADLFEGEKTYDAIRNVAYKTLKIQSVYNPAIRNDETRQKISASLRGIDLDEWDGFKESKNSLIRKSVAYQNWRERIFRRDNYTCRKCMERGAYLVVHHIKNFLNNPKFRMKIENGITLCKECHLDFHKRYDRRKNNKEQLKEYLK